MELGWQRVLILAHMGDKFCCCCRCALVNTVSEFEHALRFMENLPPWVEVYLKSTFGHSRYIVVFACPNQLIHIKAECKTKGIKQISKHRINQLQKLTKNRITSSMTYSSPFVTCEIIRLLIETGVFILFRIEANR